MVQTTNCPCIPRACFVRWFIHERNDFDEYEYHVDGQLRSVSKSTLIEKEVLEFYKKYFTFFVKNGFSELDTLKKKEKIN